MKTNVGIADRVFRIVLGVALIAFALTSGSAYAWLGWIGVVPIVTAAIGWCPAYAMFGLRTCPMRRA